MDDKTYTLFLHVTDGGAKYLVDNNNFALAQIVIRIDGGEAELIKCEIGEQNDK